MSWISRAILRGFFMLSLGWLSVYPGIVAESSVLFYVACGLCAICAVASCFTPEPFVRLRFGLHTGYFASLVGIFWLTQGLWLFPPALSGGLVAILAIVVHVLSRPSLQLPQNVTPLKKSWLPKGFTRLCISACVWLAGLLILMLYASSWTAILLMTWTCLMLVLSRGIWNFLVIPEWIGYSQRQQIFVSSKEWRRRFISFGIWSVAWIISCIVFLYFKSN